MCIIFCITVTWEMLYTAHYATAVQTIQSSRNHLSRNLRIITKRSYADNGVFRICIYISNRSKIQINSIFIKIAAYCISEVICLINVAAFRNILHICENRYIERIMICNSCNFSALFVNTYKRSYASKTVKLCCQIFKLCR